MAGAKRHLARRVLDSTGHWLDVSYEGYKSAERIVRQAASHQYGCRHHGHRGVIILAARGTA